MRSREALTPATDARKKGSLRVWPGPLTNAARERPLDQPLDHMSLLILEPIREVWIRDEGFATSRFSMIRIMARRMKAATVLA
jgi:hypothetical protein